MTHPTKREYPALPEHRAIRAGHSFPKVYALAYTDDQMKEYADPLLDEIERLKEETWTKAAQFDGLNDKMIKLRAIIERQREVIKQAGDALKYALPCAEEEWGHYNKEVPCVGVNAIAKMKDAITAMQAELEKK